MIDLIVLSQFLLYDQTLLLLYGQLGVVCTSLRKGATNHISRLKGKFKKNIVGFGVSKNTCESNLTMISGSETEFPTTSGHLHPTLNPLEN